MMVQLGFPEFDAFDRENHPYLHRNRLRELVALGLSVRRSVLMVAIEGRHHFIGDSASHGSGSRYGVTVAEAKMVLEHLAFGVSEPTHSAHVALDECA